MKTHVNITEEEWEEIEQFLSNQLPAEEADALKKKIAEDAAFAEKVAHVRLMATGIREAALESDLKKISLSDNRSSRVVSLKKPLTRWMSAAAAVVIIAVLVFSGIFEKKEARLFSKYYYPDSGLISSMGASDSYSFDVAMIDYKSGKYVKAIGEMEKLQVQDQHNDTLNYYIGNAYLASGATQKAIPYLKEVTTDNQSIFAEDANWYLGLAYLKMGQKDNAVLYISRSANEKKKELLERISK